MGDVADIMMVVITSYDLSWYTFYAWSIGMLRSSTEIHLDGKALSIIWGGWRVAGQGAGGLVEWWWRRGGGGR